MECIIKFISGKFFIYKMSTGAFILSDSRLANAKARAKKIGCVCILDDSVYGSPDAPKRAVKSHDDSIIIRDTAMASCNVASVKIKKHEFKQKEIFCILDTMVGLIVDGVLPSLVCLGSGGIGKSYSIAQSLMSRGMVEGIDWVPFCGHLSSRMVYETLWRLNGNIIVFDDTDGSLKDAQTVNLLKAALDSKEHRIISWATARSDDDGIPASFEFTGKIIFISNLTIDKIPQPLISRSMVVDIDLTAEDKLDRIEQIFLSSPENISEKIEVMAWIRANYLFFNDLNVRSAMTSLKMRLSCGDTWERMALYSASVNV